MAGSTVMIASVQCRDSIGSYARFQPGSGPAALHNEAAEPALRSPRTNGSSGQHQTV